MNKIFDEICEKISSVKKNMILIGIDGRCASGKTTLANALAEKFDCNVFHTDDFFLPFGMRTAERYAEAGGNIHYERLREEVIAPLLKGKKLSYGVFSCFEGKITHYNAVTKKRINIIEGAYSLHPYFGDIYDIKIFCDCELKERMARIEARNGKEALSAFLEKWIPLEEAYLNEHGIEGKCNFKVKQKGKK